MNTEATTRMRHKFILLVMSFCLLIQLTTTATMHVQAEGGHEKTENTTENSKVQTKERDSKEQIQKQILLDRAKREYRIQQKIVLDASNRAILETAIETTGTEVVKTAETAIQKVEEEKVSEDASQLEDQAKSEESEILEVEEEKDYPVLTKSGGVNYFNGHKETWYSERVLPGGGLDIPGRHTDENGLVRDEEGYICVASSDYPKGTIVETSLGTGKVYDCGCDSGIIDIYTNW